MLSEIEKWSDWLKVLGFLAPVVSMLLSAVVDRNVRRGFNDLRKSTSFREWKIIYFYTCFAVLRAFMQGPLFRHLLGSMTYSLSKSIDSVALSITRAQTESDKKTRTVVGMMLGEKRNNASYAYFFSLCAIFIDFALKVLFGFDSGWWVVSVSLGLVFLLQLDHKLIQYRVERGWYGGNAFETLEIIRFISSHTNPDDFNDGGGLKRIRPGAEVKVKSTRAPGVQGESA